MSKLVGRIVRFTPATLRQACNPEAKSRARGLCTRVKEDIAWVVWDHTYAPVWEIASELEPAEEEQR